MTDKIAPLDDIEVVNPLGSSTGKHKLSMFYFTINNLEQIGKLSHVYIFDMQDLKIKETFSEIKPIGKKEKYILCKRNVKYN